MKLKLAMILVAGLVSGCASTCHKACVFGFGPGNAMFNQLADSTDRQDQCQTREFSTLTGARLKEPGHVPPDYCKMRGRQQWEIKDRWGRNIGTIQQKN